MLFAELFQVIHQVHQLGRNKWQSAAMLVSSALGALYGKYMDAFQLWSGEFAHY
jgi:hypothetical protein